MTPRRSVPALAVAFVLAVAFWPGSVVAKPQEAVANAAGFRCEPHWKAHQIPAPEFPYQEGIDAISPTDAWVVGEGGGLGDPIRAWGEHFDGSSWTIERLPSPGEDESVPLDVAAAASNDVWSVGYYAGTGQGTKTLIEHWDGSLWTRFPSPSKPYSILYGAAALSATDVWAVGYWIGDTDKTLIEHMDGTSWQIISSPNAPPPYYGSDLFGVDGVAPGDVWAVGSAYGPGDPAPAIIEHWDGTEWELAAPVPTGRVANVLYGVKAFASDDVWAVGVAADNLGLDNAVPLIEHWDGMHWTVAPGPPGAPIDDRYLVAIDGRTSEDVWAVGKSRFSPFEGFAWHWDGRVWAAAPSPALLGETNLEDVSVDPTGGVWAPPAGGEVFRMCPNPVADSGFEADRITAAQGETIAWLMPTENAGDHSVTDASGVYGGMLDSGLRGPGASFVFTFNAAGSYTIEDQATGNKSAVNIPVEASPKRGTISTQFTVQWSVAPADPGFVFDIQIRGPNPEDPWVGWRQGATLPDGVFSPSTEGAFRFRARLRNVANGRSSGWSPPARVCVEPTTVC